MISILKQNKAENESNFVTLSQITEQEQIEIIKLGFQLQAQVVIEEVRAGAQQQHEVTNSVDNLAKKKYFKEMLVKHFPDFESRASLKKRQAIIYQKAVKKIKEYQRISPLLKNYQKWLMAEEKSSIDYFHGREIYKKYQDPKTPPNIIDTRKTFLKKMENQDMREKFLETYNRVNSIE